MKRMKETHEKRDNNRIVVPKIKTRPMGHMQQRVLILNPNKRRYNRKAGKAVTND